MALTRGLCAVAALSGLLLACAPTAQQSAPASTTNATATNIPLLYIEAVPVFADVDPATMNISIEDAERRITDKTKAIVCVDYGGLSNDYHRLRALCDRHGIALISDAAHSIGAVYDGRYACQYADFTIFSFQAIKTLTTADGGMLAIKDPALLPRAKRLRWFGIDREAKQCGIWENDIREIGYKYQMTDIAASMGLAGMREIDDILEHRRTLFQAYCEHLSTNRARIVGLSPKDLLRNSAWLLTIIVDRDRTALVTALREAGVESGQVHYRNDRYSILGGRRTDLPNMDSVEERYLVLPLHTRMITADVGKISELVNRGW